jgi:hypothetical protein
MGYEMGLIGNGVGPSPLLDFLNDNINYKTATQSSRITSEPSGVIPSKPEIQKTGSVLSQFRRQHTYLKYCQNPITDLDRPLGF